VLPADQPHDALSSGFLVADPLGVFLIDPLRAFSPLKLGKGIADRIEPRGLVRDVAIEPLFYAAREPAIGVSLDPSASRWGDGEAKVGPSLGVLGVFEDAPIVPDGG